MKYPLLTQVPLSSVPSHYQQQLLNLVFTWLARALGLGMLLGLMGLWRFSIMHR